MLVSEHDFYGRPDVVCYEVGRKVSDLHGDAASAARMHKATLRRSSRRRRWGRLGFLVRVDLEVLDLGVQRNAQLPEELILGLVGNVAGNVVGDVQVRDPIQREGTMRCGCKSLEMLAQDVTEKSKTLAARACYGELRRHDSEKRTIWHYGWRGASKMLGRLIVGYRELEPKWLRSVVSFVL